MMLSLKKRTTHVLLCCAAVKHNFTEQTIYESTLPIKTTAA
jgi:hypothetical protein